MPLNDVIHHRLARVTEPQILFPLVGALLLAMIWATALGVIRMRHTYAEHAAEQSTRELLDTYEAQVVRALREIDQTLNLVKFWPEGHATRHSLADLQSKGLLPPELIFTVSIADRDGVIVDSTRPVAHSGIADQDYFRTQRVSDELFVERLRRGPTNGSTLHFSRRLSTENGAFDGVVVVAVEASYFVSGYDATKLGEHGVLGLIGSDGFFRVRRIGKETTSGEAVDYTNELTDGPDLEPKIAISTVDGVARWAGTREVYGWPLAVRVGLSVNEQMAGTNLWTRIGVWLSAAGSVLVLLLTGVLGRMTWQVAQLRARESRNVVEHAQRVEHLAYHDALTGLPNRSLFSKLLTQSLAEARRHSRRFAVLFLDLDRFKHINDTLGHEAGDQLLREVAHRLSSCVRDSDTVARLGGDEFVVLLPELADEHYAAIVAQKLLAAAARPFMLIGQEFRVSVSIGISTYPQDGIDEQTLTKNADIAMYQAKADGKNNFQFYSKQLNAYSLERLTLESSLRHALERDEFRIHYQAKRDIINGRITGMEALLRWEHPELGMVAPMRFIPVAEETGLIVPIGRWVLKTVCEQSVAWQEQGLPPLSIAVNVTPRQFCDEQLLSDVTTILKETGISPGLLEIELTERLLIQNIGNTSRILKALKGVGVRIGVDEFGGGYSTLAMLQRFPLDTIKIDRSLVRDFAGPSNNAGLADAIIAMGKSLSLTVVAQGVETEEQANFLRLHACDELQGFYFKKPLPPDAFAELLRRETADNTCIGEPLSAKAGS